MRENRYITDFYNHYDEDGRLALRHGSVEFLTTMRYIEKYLRPGCRVPWIYRRRRGAGSA